MAWKQIAIAAALLGAATPGEAFDNRDEAQTVMLYYAIPFGAPSYKQNSPWFGMQIQGKRDYQPYTIDTRLVTFTRSGIDAPLFNFAEGGAAQASLVVIGAVAVGAA